MTLDGVYLNLSQAMQFKYKWVMMKNGEFVYIHYTITYDIAIIDSKTQRKKNKQFK